MQSNLIILPTPPLNTIEAKLFRMQKLDKEIEVLDAEFKMLKEQVISEYFCQTEEYKTAKGLVLATYISYKEKRFNSKAFEKDFPDIYEGYKKENTVFKFSLK